VHGAILIIAIALLAAAGPLRPTPAPPHASRTGTLVVSWTFGGRATSDACEQLRVTTVEIDVFDRSSSEIAHLEPPCASFAATAALPEGSYQIRAVPEDYRGRLVSVPMQDRVALEAGTSKRVSFNFPSWAVARHARGALP